MGQLYSISFGKEDQAYGDSVLDMHRIVTGRTLETLHEQ
jgi:hypothetical protein